MESSEKEPSKQGEQKENKLNEKSDKNVSGENSESDFSFSINVTPPLLPDSSTKPVRSLSPKDPSTEASISEEIEEDIKDSDENDRSLHEIEISHKSDQIDLINMDEPKEDAETSAQEVEILSETKNSSRRETDDKLMQDKDATIAALTAELDSMKEISNNTSTVSENSTAYYPLPENYAARLHNFQKELAERERIIQELTEALQDSVKEREKLQKQGEVLASEISLFETQLIETKNLLSKQNSGQIDFKFSDIKTEIEKIESLLNGDQQIVFNQFKAILNQYLNDTVQIENLELKAYINRLESEHSDEIKRLHELLSTEKSSAKQMMEMKSQLEAKHESEMEKLRFYFQDKCADLERNYSDGILSQNSQNIVDSSSCSESELVSDMNCSGPPAMLSIGPDGDKCLKKLRHKKAHRKTPDIIKKEVELTNQTELAIIQSNFDDKVEEIMKNSDLAKEELKHIYTEQIRTLKEELESLRNEKTPPAASSSEEELAEVVMSYERRLREQVELAKNDLILALESKIKKLIDNDAEDNQWPEEFLQLRDILSNRYTNEIENLKQRHAAEITKLKSGNEKFIVRTIEREKQKNKDTMSLSEMEKKYNQIILERDDEIKKNVSLNHVINELIRYVSVCEQEVNNTIVGELFKDSFDNLEMTMSPQKDNSFNNSQLERTKIHFASEISDLVKSFTSNLNSSTTDLHGELEVCLKKLRQDAAQVLLLSTNLNRRQTLDETHPNKSNQNSFCDTDATKSLLDQIQIYKNEISKLENENIDLRNQIFEANKKNEELSDHLDLAKEKILEFVTIPDQKEIVSEGFGESDIPPLPPLESPRETFAQALERARRQLEEEGDSISQATLVTLVEALCRSGQRAQEDSQRDIHDLQLQVILQIIQRVCSMEVEAADKKLRATIQFLDDQTTEREAEREEAVRQLTLLQSQLAQRDRECSMAQQIANDKMLQTEIVKTVEHLETQMRTMAAMIEDNKKEKQLLEQELKTAVDKVWYLRDIIRDLESQVETKTEIERQLEKKLSDLQQIIQQQHRNNEQLAHDIDSMKSLPDTNELLEHTAHLQAELNEFQHYGTIESFKQLVNQLEEIELSVHKEIKELEVVHESDTRSCGTPTEDISVADKSRPGTGDRVFLLLDHAQKIHKALQKFNRVKVATVKKLKDSESLLGKLQKQHEIVLCERDALQERSSEQSMEISSLQMRLDKQRQLVQTITKESTMSLENKIYDLESEIKNLKETVNLRDKQLKQLQNVLDKTVQRLNDAEKEISHNSVNEHEKERLKSEIINLQSQNELLKIKLDQETSQKSNISPELIDSLLASKNAEIDVMSSELKEMGKELQLYQSLNLDKEQLKELSQSLKENSEEGKSSARTLSDVVSISEFDEADMVMRHAPPAESTARSMRDDLYHSQETPIPKFNSLPFAHFHQINARDLSKVLTPPNVSSIHCIDSKLTLENDKSEKRVHFSDLESPNYLKMELNEIKLLLNEKNEKLEESEKLLAELNEKNDGLEKENNSIKSEKDALNNLLSQTQIDLNELRSKIDEKSTEINSLNTQLSQINNLYVTTIEEKQILQGKVSDLKDELLKLHNVELQLIEKNNLVEKLEEKLREKFTCDKEQLIAEVQVTLEEKYKAKFDEIDRLNKYIENLQAIIDERTQEKNQIADKLHHIENDNQIQLKDLFDKISDKNCEIKILNEDITRYKEEIKRLTQHLQDLPSIDYNVDSNAKLSRNVKEKDLILMKKENELQDLRKEILHLQDYLQEKDKIINQVTEDSNSLRKALETIQNKMKETGNILDLTKKLKNEQLRSAKLEEEIKVLKSESLNRPDTDEKQNAFLEDITGQMQRELDYSARLDFNILNAVQNKENKMVQSSFSEDQSSYIEILSTTNEKIMKEVNEIKASLKIERENCRKLGQLLEEEKRNSHTIQMQDASLIEQMRLRLEAALDAEIELQKLIENERQMRASVDEKLKRFENELAAHVSGAEHPSLESIVKEQQFDMLAMKKEMEELKNLGTIDDQMIEENVQLKIELAEMKNRVEDLSKRLNDNNVNVVKERDSLVQLEEMNSQMEHLMKQMEKSTGEKRALEIEIEKLKKELSISRLQETKLNELLITQRDAQLNNPVPVEFLQKLEEMKNDLSSSINDNRILTEKVTQLVEHRRILEAKLSHLQNNLESQPKFENDDKYCVLFGRYLRVESYRKSLAWQKQYLSAIIYSYESKNRVKLLPPVTKGSRNLALVKTKITFRQTAFAIVAIFRMKFLVRRWSTGPRLNGNLFYRQKYKRVTSPSQLVSPTIVQNMESDNGRNEKTPRKQIPSSLWSGMTPPNRDVSHINRNMPSTSSNREQPYQLSSYLQRFDHIQRTFGLVPQSLPP